MAGGYLTEGWARRFLVDLFRSFTVLFVGYNHNDTVMTYLARALPPGDEHLRFVLTDDADLGRWQLLGIRTSDLRPNHPGMTIAPSMRVFTDSPFTQGEGSLIGNVKLRRSQRTHLPSTGKTWI